MTYKHFFKNIFLVSKFCYSLTDKIPKKSFTKLLEKKIVLFLLAYTDFQFLQNRKATFIKALLYVFFSV